MLCPFTPHYFTELVPFYLERGLRGNQEKLNTDLERKFGVFLCHTGSRPRRVQGCIKLEMKINLEQLIFIKVIVVYLYLTKTK